MSIFKVDIQQVPNAVSVIAGFIKDNSILCAVLFISYALFYLYSFIHNKSVDSEVYEGDLLGNSISSIMVALMLIGLSETSKGFSFTSLNFSSPQTKIAIFLVIYAIILLFFAFTKILPGFLVVILGNNELDLFINFVAILMIEPKIIITGTLLAVIGVPLFILLIIQRIRRLMR